jgi:hypothetical protein
LFCSFCNVIGWGLSLGHQLRPTGYWVTLAGGLAVWALACRRLAPSPARAVCVRRLARRFRRPFPFSFLVLAFLSFVGGALHAPTNYDGLAYRLPRSLNWLAEGRWHWIPTEFNRINTRAPGFEWVSTPIIALTSTDRFLFLINIVSFLLLPGLVFALFTRLGVRRRAAWHWMWLVPTGYCFLLQSGSIGNDMFGACLTLCAMVFALRARESHSLADLSLSILGAALMTSSKASNMPLLLPWAVALFPALVIVRRRFVVVGALSIVALVVSLAPQLVLNQKFSGDWSGAKAENAEFISQASWAHVVNNTALLALQNFAPPIFPFTTQWAVLADRIQPAFYRKAMLETFEPAGAKWSLPEMAMEEAAGLGFGVSVLLLVSACAAFRNRRAAKASADFLLPRDKFIVAVLVASVIALYAFLLKSGMTVAARIATPYYCLLLPLFLTGRFHEALVRRPWWRRAGLAVFALGALLVVISPPRPLWPANWALDQVKSDSGLLARARTVYSVYSRRAYGFEPVRQHLPPGIKRLGLVTSDDPETSLWRPFGSLRVIHLSRSDSADTLLARDVHHVLVHASKVESSFQLPLEAWLARMRAKVIAKIPLQLRAREGPSDWLLIEVRPENRGS